MHAPKTTMDHMRGTILERQPGVAKQARELPQVSRSSTYRAQGGKEEKEGQKGAPRGLASGPVGINEI